jgi:hypothetical protein
MQIPKQDWTLHAKYHKYGGQTIPLTHPTIRVTEQNHQINFNFNFLSTLQKNTHTYFENYFDFEDDLYFIVAFFIQHDKGLIRKSSQTSKTEFTGVRRSEGD